MSEDLRQAVTRRGSLLDTIRTVAWAFFGVRRRDEFLRESARVNPVHVIIAGILGAALFVFLLLVLVRWVIASATHA